MKIYVQAERFRYCDERMRALLSSDDPRPGSYIALPSIVLSAFASELYLKCLLCLEDQKVPRTHNLHKLHKRLSSKLRRRLDASWQTSRLELEPFFEVARRAFNYEPHIDLDGAIAEGALAFEELRYAYERTPKSRFYLGPLPRLLRAAILELRPEWSKVGPSFGPIDDSFVPDPR